MLFYFANYRAWSRSKMRRCPSPPSASSPRTWARAPARLLRQLARPLPTSCRTPYSSASKHSPSLVPWEFLQLLFFVASGFLTGKKKKRYKMRTSSSSAQVSGFDHFSFAVCLVLHCSTLRLLFQAATQITHTLVIISII